MMMYSVGNVFGLDSFEVVLRKRKGFVRLAVENGMDIVPAFCFGEKWIHRVVQLPEALHGPPASTGGLVVCKLRMPYRDLKSASKRASLQSLCQASLPYAGNGPASPGSHELTPATPTSAAVTLCRPGGSGTARPRRRSAANCAASQNARSHGRDFDRS